MAGEKRQRGGGGGGGRGRGGNEDRSAKRRRYAAAAGGKGKAKASAGEIRGPGLWLSCARRKEAISTSEAYDLLNDVADRLYPGTSTQTVPGSSRNLDKQQNGEEAEDEDDIEAQIAKELEEMQPTIDPETGKKKMRFQGVRTDTECCCAPPLDPVQLTYAIADDLQNGGPIRTRFLQRITPVTNTTHADPNSLKRLAYRILQPLIAPTDYTIEQRDSDEPIKYRIEPSLRNHTVSLNRQVVMDIIGEVVRDLANAHFQFPRRQAPEDGTSEVSEQPESSSTVTEKVEGKDGLEETTQATTSQEEDGEKQPLNGDEEQESSVEPQEIENATVEETPWHVLPSYRRRIHVDLKNPTHTILVSALRGVCGISVVEGYDQRKKFNVQMLGGNLPTPGGKSKDKEVGDTLAEADQQQAELHVNQDEVTATEGPAGDNPIAAAVVEVPQQTQATEKTDKPVAQPESAVQDEIRLI